MVVFSPFSCFAVIMMRESVIKMPRVILCQMVTHPLDSQREWIHQLSGRTMFFRQLTFSLTAPFGNVLMARAGACLSLPAFPHTSLDKLPGLVVSS